MRKSTSTGLAFVSHVLLWLGFIDFGLGILVVGYIVGNTGWEGVIVAIPTLLVIFVFFCSCMFLPYCGLALAEIHRHFCDVESIASAAPLIPQAAPPRRYTPKMEELPPEWEQALHESPELLPDPPVMTEIPEDWPDQPPKRLRRKP